MGFSDVRGLSGRQCKFQREVVTLAPKTAYRSDCKVGKIRVPSERFPGVDVGQMHFNERDLNCGKSISKCNTGVGKSPRIDDDPGDSLFLCGVYAFYESTFMVALKHVYRRAKTPGCRAKPFIDDV